MILSRSYVIGFIGVKDFWSREPFCTTGPIFLYGRRRHVDDFLIRLIQIVSLLVQTVQHSTCGVSGNISTSFIEERT